MPKRNKSKSKKIGVTTPQQATRAKLDSMARQIKDVRKITGSGDYRSALAKVTTDLGAMLRPHVKGALTMGGQALGSYAGSKIGLSKTGGAAGAALGARLSKLLGSGDYVTSEDVMQNSLIKGNVNQNMSFSSNAATTRIMHREYIRDISTGVYTDTAGANTFNIESFAINPGVTATFPYLSSIALNYEEYRIHGMIFEFVSSTSPYNSTSAMGTYIMSMEYDAAANAFTSKPQMENSDFAISARFDKCCMYGVECKTNVQNAYYVRYTDTTLPLTTTDLGTFYFATQPAVTFPSESVIGELWVTYDIEFARPRITPARFGLYSRVYQFVQPVNASLVIPLDIPLKSYSFGTLSKLNVFGITLGGNGGGSLAGTFGMSGSDGPVGDLIQVIITAAFAIGESGGSTYNSTLYPNFSSAGTLGVVPVPLLQQPQPGSGAEFVPYVSTCDLVNDNVTTVAYFRVAAPQWTLVWGFQNFQGNGANGQTQVTVNDLGNGLIPDTGYSV